MGNADARSERADLSLFKLSSLCEAPIRFAVYRLTSPPRRPMSAPSSPVFPDKRVLDVPAAEPDSNVQSKGLWARTQARFAALLRMCGSCGYPHYPYVQWSCSIKVFGCLLHFSRCRWTSSDLSLPAAAVLERLIFSPPPHRHE